MRVWKSLGHQPEQFNFKLNGLGEDSIPDMSALKVNVRTWDPMDSYINVQVSEFELSTRRNLGTDISYILMYKSISYIRQRHYIGQYRWKPSDFVTIRLGTL